MSRRFTEAEYLAVVAKWAGWDAPRVSRTGVREHTADGGRGGGAVGRICKVCRVKR
jgi:hypothetical protein